MSEVRFGMDSENSKEVNVYCVFFRVGNERYNEVSFHVGCLIVTARFPHVGVYSSRAHMKAVSRGGIPIQTPYQKTMSPDRMGQRTSDTWMLQ